jgi:Fe2+ or Zn2+ uptake regulation protein
MFPLERLHTELTRRHISRTAARDETYCALAKLGEGTLAQLMVELPRAMHSRTLKRTLTLFLEIGVINQIDTGVYELADPYRQHHHHITCPTCGKRTNFFDPTLEKNIQRLISRRRLTLSGHHIELTAVCGLCLAKRLPLHKIPLTTDIA